MSAPGGRELVITIDGPAGSGKSTIARLLARRLGFLYIDSGALYRATTWVLQEQGVTRPEDLNDTTDDRVLRIVSDRKLLSLENDAEGATRLYCRGRDITAEIRSKQVERLVPLVAQRGRIRQAVTDVQRVLASGHSVVVEGRDAGTVVFPDAPVKFFLTASVRARAQRRFLELRRKIESVPLAECIMDIDARDTIDTTRAIAPLRPASDAIVLDTSNYGLKEVLEFLLRHVEKRLVVAPIPLRQTENPRAILIVVAGLIGVGKSSFCEWLSSALGIPVFSENPDANPYIRLAYKEPSRWAMHSQMWFLYRKYELLASIGDQKTSGIIDRSLHEDYMLARVCLSRPDFELYERWYSLALSLVSKPSLLISLEASVPVLLERIAKRGRTYERDIAPEYLEKLSLEYDAWIGGHSETPLIRIQTEKHDPRTEKVREAVLSEVQEVLREGEGL